MPFMEAPGAPPRSGPSIPLGPFRLDRCIGRGGMAGLAPPCSRRGSPPETGRRSARKPYACWGTRRGAAATSTAPPAFTNAASPCRTTSTAPRRASGGSATWPASDLAQQRFTAAEATLREARESLQRFGWGGLLSCVHVSLLACAAQAREWTVWDDHLALGAEALRQSGFLDPDVARCAELAGRLTEWGGEPARARAVYGLAMEQWRGLGDAASVQRIERTLAPR